MGYKEFAEQELRIAGYNIEDRPDDPDGWIVDNLLELLEVFSKQQHSGFSARYCISMFKKLASFEPLTPLTGGDDEWSDVSQYGGGVMYQNKRSGRIFKDSKDGRAYDIEGKVFRESDGCCFTNNESKVYIEFPYTPVTEYIDINDTQLNLFDKP